MLKIDYPVFCGMDVHKKLVIASIAFTDFKNVTTYKKKRVATFNSDLKSLEKSLLTTITLKSAWNLPGNTEFLFLIFWKNYAMSLSPQNMSELSKDKKTIPKIPHELLIFTNLTLFFPAISHV